MPDPTKDLLRILRPRQNKPWRESFPKFDVPNHSGLKGNTDAVGYIGSNPTTIPSTYVIYSNGTNLTGTEYFYWDGSTLAVDGNINGRNVLGTTTVKAGSGQAVNAPTRTGTNFISQNDNSLVSTSSGIAVIGASQSVSFIDFSDENAAARGSILYNHSTETMDISVSGSKVLSISPTLLTLSTSKAEFVMDSTDTTQNDIIRMKSGGVEKGAIFHLANTGIFELRAGNGCEMRLASNGATFSPSITISSNGYVGIGTTTPTNTLDIKNQIVVDGINNRIGIRTVAPTEAITVSAGKILATQASNTVIQDWRIANTERSMLLTVPNSADNDSPFIFDTNNSYYFRMDSNPVLKMIANRNIGIGINADSAISNTLTLSGSFLVNQGATNCLSVSTNGFVGIGTTTPTATLTVSGAITSTTAATGTFTTADSKTVTVSGGIVLSIV